MVLAVAITLHRIHGVHVAAAFLHDAEVTIEVAYELLVQPVVLTGSMYDKYRAALSKTVPAYVKADMVLPCQAATGLLAVLLAVPRRLDAAHWADFAQRMSSTVF